MAERERRVVRDQLQRHDRQRRREQRQRVGDREQFVDRLRDLFPVAPVHQPEHPGAARLHFLDVAQRLLVQILLRHERDDRRAFFDQRQRAVLQLARRVRLRVDVRDLLQLQRAFLRDRPVDAPADEEQVAVPRQRLRDLLEHPGMPENVLHLRGKLLHGGDDRRDERPVLRAQRLRKIQTEQIERDELRRVRLRRRDGDLRTRPGDDHVIRLAGDGAADDVRDGQHARARALRFAQRRQRVGRLAGLADDDDQRIRRDDRIAVSVFGGDVRLHRNAREALDDVLADEAGVQRRAAGDDVNPADRANLVRRQLDLRQHDLPAVRRNARSHRIAVRLRLLVDLLQHEVLEAGLLRRHQVPVDVEDALGDGPSVGRHHQGPGPRQHGHLAVLENVHVARMLENRRDVRRDEELALADADDERARVAHRHELIRLVLRQHAERERAAHPLHRPLHRRHNVAFILVRDQVGHDLRIRLRHERVPGDGQFLAQLEIIFDDAVVDDREFARVVRMRVRVDIRRLAVRRPARVADADRAGERRFLQLLLQHGEPALRLADLEPLAGVDGDARRVVSPILELLQALDQDLLRVPVTDISYNSAHSFVPPLFGKSPNSPEVPERMCMRVHMRLSAHAACRTGNGAFRVIHSA